MVFRFATGHPKDMNWGRDLLALWVTTSTCKYMPQVQLFAAKLEMEGPLLLPCPTPWGFALWAAFGAQLWLKLGTQWLWWQHWGRGHPSPSCPSWGGSCLTRARRASPVLTGEPGGPLGPSFPVSPGGPRAPGGPGGPGGPMAPSRPWSPWKKFTQTWWDEAVLAKDGLRVSTTHALHPWATLASAVPEEFNCSFQLGKLKVSSRLICAIRVWFLNQDCAQRLPTRFNLLKPLPSDCLDGNTNPTAPRIAQAHNMLAESMHTLPWLSTPHQKTTQKKVAVLNLILYRQPGSPVNILSRSHPVGFGCREHAVPLWLCRAGGCPSQGGNQAGNQPLAPQQPAQPSPRAVALPIHAAAQWESLMERPPRKSFSNIWESHHRGSQRAVFNMRSTLKSGTSVGFFRSP